MFSLGRTYFIIISLLFFSGCSLINTKENIVTKEKETKIIKKKRVLTKKPKIRKRTFSYKYCKKHINIMNHASNYIENAFNKGYFIKKDILGAKAQLFLIENKSPSIFAKNINSALTAYDKQYFLAKKNKCNLNKHQISPLKKIKNKINEF